ncbi:hypothetical protein CEXT_11151 [Caerostris extrusa]|uniref:Uncharacterized protein n=1 Tax=Caerostris extrusa TaxID=172846 RepID=A0AAV4XFG0_CAEEX|nr:hypothetical protein CEXT_11151 [Caerostris extrusa]
MVNNQSPIDAVLIPNDQRPVVKSGTELCPELILPDTSSGCDAFTASDTTFLLQDNKKKNLFRTLRGG